jgi:hypothetical protein
MSYTTKGENMVKVIRMMSGEEILAEIEQKDGGWLLKKPCIIIPADRQSLGIMSWMSYCDTREGIHIPEKFVAFMVNPSTELAAEYEAATSKIIKPSKGLVSPQLSLVGE